MSRADGKTSEAAASLLYEETLTDSEKRTLNGVLGSAPFASLKNQGYSLIATNPCFPTYPASVAVGSGTTHKTRHKSLVKASSLRLVFANLSNIQASQVNANYNSIMVGASLQPYGSSANDDTPYLQPASFNGHIKTTIDPGLLVYSDPIAFPVAANQDFFCRTWQGLYRPAAPADPTLTPAGTGGNLVATATYYICTVYVFADGSESLTSGGVSATIPGAVSTGSISVSSPAANGAAIGYQVYMGSRNGGNALYAKTGEITAIGTAATVTTEISANPLYFKRAGGPLYSTGGQGGGGGTQYAGIDNGEGFATGDQTSNGFKATTNTWVTNQFFPVAILGITETPQKTVGLIGDSIQAGTGDNGHQYASGGFGTRAVGNQMSLVFDPAATPLNAHVRVPLGGESAANFAESISATQRCRARREIVELATNVISNYGTNDSIGASTLKTNLVSIGSYYASRKIKFFQCTLLPKTTSTDGWQTASNQTVNASFEAQKLTINTWLRDTSASGFVAQVNAAAGTTGYAAIIDICKYCEVNSSNVLTMDGGFWRVPTGYTPVSCIVTGTSGGASITDSSKVWTRNQYKGWCLVFTSGAAAGKVGCIGYNTTAGNVDVYSAPGATPSNGDTYLITQVATIDGTHPSTVGHLWAAQAVQEILPDLI